MPTIVGADPARLGDIINAGNGRNLVFGRQRRDHAASSNAARFGALPFTLGLVQTIESLLGGADSITTGSGDDIVLGGIDGDTIGAGDGNNVVIGDSGQIVWTAAELRRRAPPATISIAPTSTARLDRAGRRRQRHHHYRLGRRHDHRRRGRRGRQRHARQLAGGGPDDA